KLSGTNFTNWYRNLRIVLKQEKKEYVLEQPYPDEPENGASASNRRAYEKHCNDSFDVSCLMLVTMSPELQKQYEDSEAYNMIEGSVACLRTRQGSRELAMDVILRSLPPSFEPFIMNYHMNGLDKTLTELHGMLKTAEDSIKKTSHHVMMVQRDSKKRRRKGKGKGKAEDRIQKPRTDAKPKVGLSPSDKCFHCGDSGHWSRNCQKYLEEKKIKKESETSASGAKSD
ncbi:hypothetical protein U9M48_004520, partial [Paspalum notatum var. saurae]